MKESAQPLRPVRPRFKPYPAYKDSGVEWLGGIPAHWEVKRLKFVAAEPIKNGIGEAGAHDDPEWPRYVRISDIAGPRELREDTFKSLPPDLAREAPFRVGDILFAAVGATFGKSYLHLRDVGPVCFAGYMVRFSPGRRVAPTFAAYWTESSAYWALVQSRVVQATIQNFSAARYKELALPLPSVAEQRAISAFLDRETARIDALVAKKERLIELLQEKRTALITRAVTRSLDPNVPVKDSGVEWLGGIPAHWEVKPLGQSLSRITYGFTNPMPVADEGPYMLTAFDVGDGEILFENARRTTEEAFVHLLTDKSRPRAGDVLITKDGTLGRVAVAGGERMCINQSVALLRFNPAGADIDFVQNALRAAPYQDRMVFEAGGTAIKHIYVSRLAKMPIALPPVRDQAKIGRFIAGHRVQLNSLIAKVRDAIDRLRELRTALISAAVTGKIDVQHEVA